MKLGWAPIRYDLEELQPYGLLTMTPDWSGVGVDGPQTPSSPTSGKVGRVRKAWLQRWAKLT